VVHWYFIHWNTAEAIRQNASSASSSQPVRLDFSKRYKCFCSLLLMWMVYDAVSSNKLEKAWWLLMMNREESVAYLIFYPGIRLNSLKKTEIIKAAGTRPRSEDGRPRKRICHRNRDINVLLLLLAPTALYVFASRQHNIHELWNMFPRTLFIPETSKQIFIIFMTQSLHQKLSSEFNLSLRGSTITLIYKTLKTKKPFI
jgi:hypothetical protein